MPFTKENMGLDRDIRRLMKLAIREHLFLISVTQMKRPDEASAARVLIHRLIPMIMITLAGAVNTTTDTVSSTIGIRPQFRLLEKKYPLCAQKRTWRDLIGCKTHINNRG